MSPPLSQTPNSSPATSQSESDSEQDPTPWNQSSARFTSKRYSEYFDPCQDAANRSLKCMRRNGGDRAMCMDYFEAYKQCKKSWQEEQKEQKRREGKGWFG